MAIYHLTTKSISRGKGQNAVASASYRAAEKLKDEQIGKTFNYSRRKGVLYSEIIMPDPANTTIDRNLLWNLAEKSEKRKDARVAREWEGAIPHELEPQDAITLVKDFANEYSQYYNVPVDLAIHAPHEKGDQRNIHFHMMVTTRNLNKDTNSLDKKVSIELSDTYRKKFGLQGRVRDEIYYWRGRWAELVNRHLENSGLTERIDHRSFKDQNIQLIPTIHVGPTATNMARNGKTSYLVALNQSIREENIRRINENPLLLIDKITATKSTFTESDIAKNLLHYVDNIEQFNEIISKIKQHQDIIQLSQEKVVNKKVIPAIYSSQKMISLEQEMLNTVQQLCSTISHKVNVRNLLRAFSNGKQLLTDEQKQAVMHILEEEQFSVLVGDAGTGKSYTIGIAREAWETEGYNVIGAALSGKAAAELEAGSDIKSYTLAALEMI